MYIDEELETGEELGLSTSFNEPLSLITGLLSDRGLLRELLCMGFMHTLPLTSIPDGSLTLFNDLVGAELHLVDLILFLRRLVFFAAFSSRLDAAGGEDERLESDELSRLSLSAAAVLRDSHSALLMAASSAGRIPPMSLDCVMWRNKQLIAANTI